MNKSKEYLGCFALVLSRVVLELSRVVLVLSRVVSCCICVVSCCICVVSCCTRVVLCSIVLSGVVSCCYSCSFLDLILRWQVLEKKDWELSLEMKSNECISVFPLILQFPLSVLCSCKSANNCACNGGL